MVTRNTAFPIEKLCSTNLSVIDKESSAQADLMKGPKWIEGRPRDSQENQTPQMRPKAPINCFKNAITIKKSITFVNIFLNIFIPFLA